MITVLIWLTIRPVKISEKSVVGTATAAGAGMGKESANMGEEITLTDLPHELLVEVVKQLGFVHQQRLVRVCRLWRNTICTDLDHVYLDATTLYGSCQAKTPSGLLDISVFVSDNQNDFLRRELCYRWHDLQETFTRGTEAETRRLRRVTHPWKYNQRFVRQLTFNGQKMAGFGSAAFCLMQMATAFFPGLMQANLVHVIMDILDVRCSWAEYDELLRGLVQLSTAVSLTMKDSMISAFPPEFSSEPPHDAVYAVDYSAYTAVLGRYQSSFVEIADVIWTTGEFSRSLEQFAFWDEMAWPYPDSQLEWLARCAPRLNRNEDLLKLLQGYRSGIFLCKEHYQFCDHLDLSFYRVMDGQLRNTLVAWLFQLNLLQGMDSPPVPFRFLKYQLADGGKPARLGPV